MRLGGLVYHCFDKWSVNLRLLPDRVELRRILILHLLDNFWFHFRFLPLFSQFLLSFFLLGLFFLKGLASVQGTLQHLLTFQTLPLDVCQVLCVLFHFLLLTTSATIASTARATSIVIVTIGIAVDMLARLCKTTLQFLQVLLSALPLCVCSIDTVQFALRVTALRTVCSLLFIAQRTNSGVSTFLAEAFVHFSHLVSHLLIGCIRQ